MMRTRGAAIAEQQASASLLRLPKEVLLQIVIQVEDPADARSFFSVAHTMHELAEDPVLVASWLHKHRHVDAWKYAAQINTGSMLNLLRLQPDDEFCTAKCAKPPCLPPLLLAVMYDRPAAITQLLQREGVRSRTEQADAVEALHMAVTAGSVECMEALLQLNCLGPNSLSNCAWSPLHTAAQYARLEVTQYLLDRGADPTLKDSKQMTPLLRATRQAKDADARVAVMKALISTPSGKSMMYQDQSVMHSIPIKMMKRVEIHRDSTTGESTFYVKLQIDDGQRWEVVKEKRDAERQALQSRGASEQRVMKNGFWVAKADWRAWSMPHILLASEAPAGNWYLEYQLQRPYQSTKAIWNLELSGRLSEHQLAEKYRPLEDDEEAQSLWQRWFDALYTGCLHGPRCVARQQKGYCPTGNRTFYKHAITGPLLPVLDRLIKIHETSDHGRSSTGIKKAPRMMCCKVESVSEEVEQQIKAAQDAGDESSVVPSPTEPQLMVGLEVGGLEMYEGDVEALLQEMGVQQS